MRRIEDIINERREYDVKAYSNEINMVDIVVIYLVEILKDFYKNYELFMQEDVDKLDISEESMDKLTIAVSKLAASVKYAEIASISSVEYIFDCGKLDRSDSIGKVINYTDEVSKDMIISLTNISKIVGKLSTVHYLVKCMLEEIKIFDHIHTETYNNYKDFEDWMDEMDDMDD